MIIGAFFKALGLGSGGSGGGQQTPYTPLALHSMRGGLDKYKVGSKRRVKLTQNVRNAKVIGSKESFENKREEAENELEKADPVRFSKMERGLRMAGWVT